MKIFFWQFIFCIYLFSCNNDKKIPDVSGVKIELKVQRFEKDFFSIDTSNVLSEMERLRLSYPNFINDFTNRILGFDFKTSPDSLSKFMRLFIRDYHFIKDSSDKKFGDFEEEINEVKKGLQYVKYYFPAYKLPFKIITFIGPFDGYSDVLTADALAVGLQLHMGKDFSFYKSGVGKDLFPDYIAKKFEPEYIPVNCLKNIIDDLFPDKSMGKPLVEQMVEKGKRIYLLDKFLPYTKDFLKVGYSELQLKDCYANEAVIWDFFLNNELLNNGDQNITKNYIGESPKTPELGEGSPGNIGSFSGWQIVKKFMSGHPNISLRQLMQMDSRELYSQSKYKPRT